MTEEKKNCPYCGEEILAVAIKCKHCQSMLNEQNIINKSEAPLFSTTKVYLGAGFMLPQAPGTLTMYSDYLEFIPGGLRLVKGEQVFLKYKDIVSLKFPLSPRAELRIKTRQGEEFGFQAGLWNKSIIDRIAGILRGSM